MSSELTRLKGRRPITGSFPAGSEIGAEIP